MKHKQGDYINSLVYLHAAYSMHPTETQLSDTFSLQDEASYIAGERAALLRAFRETLPSQQALGSLFHAVQHLTKRMDQEGNDVHQVRHSTQDCMLWVNNQCTRLPGVLLPGNCNFYLAFMASCLK